ncbi:MAG TPA: zinc ribbon domain-containing protein [Syntrophales bacterium]|nr:zinc ribbon domain-containing protein [Syntrophales bacterium]HOM06269.1 zinc ribbon domain-containing protein [Syntrophales bacterium]
MPTYEYLCEGCGAAVERRQGMMDPPLTVCPHCGGPLKRLISGGGGFIVKGSAGRHPDRSGACSFADAGTTCCGRPDPCEHPGCGARR